MSDKEKKAFNDMAEKDRIRYEREMKNYVPPPGTKKTKKKKDPNAPKRPQYVSIKTRWCLSDNKWCFVFLSMYIAFNINLLVDYTCFGNF